MRTYVSDRVFAALSSTTFVLLIFFLSLSLSLSLLIRDTSFLLLCAAWLVVRIYFFRKKNFFSLSLSFNPLSFARLFYLLGRSEKRNGTYGQTGRFPLYVRSKAMCKLHFTLTYVHTFACTSIVRERERRKIAAADAYSQKHSAGSRGSTISGGARLIGL